MDEGMDGGIDGGSEVLENGGTSGDDVKLRLLLVFLILDVLSDALLLVILLSPLGSRDQALCLCDSRCEDGVDEVDELVEVLEMEEWRCNEA